MISGRARNSNWSSICCGKDAPLKIEDDNVSLGRLIGSNRQHIEQAIPHVGSLLGE
jgi:hypothetical protein